MQSCVLLVMSCPLQRDSAGRQLGAQSWVPLAYCKLETSRGIVRKRYISIGEDVINVNRGGLEILTYCLDRQNFNDHSAWGCSP